MHLGVSLMKYLLVGFMGSGKSTLAKLLSQKLGLRLVELDEEIVKVSNRKDIPEIFEIDGEKKFRELESARLQQALELEQVVISAGGGAVISETNRENVKKSGARVLYLRTSFEAIKGRVGKDLNRPLFKDDIKAKNLYDSRRSIYESVADYVIDTDNKNPEEVLEQVLEKIK